MSVYGLLLIVLSTSYLSGNRVRRIVNGKRVIGRDGPYDAVRYLVAIADVHETHWYTFGFFISFLRYFGVYGTVACGGALLTPRIVQTACHCLAFLNTGPDRGRAEINHHWENERVVYIGMNDRFEGLDGAKAFMDVYPVKGKRYFIHERCEKLPPGTVRAISYDYGYVSMDPDWVKGKKDGVPIKGVDFAPLYTTREIVRTYYRFIRTPPVCLVVGYGDTENERGYFSISDYSTHGWVELLSDFDCREVTKLGWSAKEFQEVRSWFCSGSFPKHFDPPFYGDSGGPLTCNNAFVALVSGGAKKFTKEVDLALYGSIAYTVYANAYEYREAFESEIRRKSNFNFEEIVYKIVDELGSEFLEEAAEEILPELLPAVRDIKSPGNSSFSWVPEYGEKPIREFKLRTSFIEEFGQGRVSSSSLTIHSAERHLIQCFLLFPSII